MPEPGKPGGQPGFMNRLIQVHPEQTHATQLNGTAGRGYFKPGLVVVANGIFGMADAAADWEIRLEMPKPGGGTQEYLLDMRSATLFIANNDVWRVPAGGVIKVISSATTNPRATLITRLHQENI